VVDRPVLDGTQPSLVFSALREGSYGLGLKGVPEVLLTATVRGGEVTTLTWPG